MKREAEEAAEKAAEEKCASPVDAADLALSLCTSLIKHVRITLRFFLPCVRSGDEE